MNEPDWALERAREIALNTGYSLQQGYASYIVKAIAAELRKERERAEDTASDLEICHEMMTRERLEELRVLHRQTLRPPYGEVIAALAKAADALPEALDEIERLWEENNAIGSDLDRT